MFHEFEVVVWSCFCNEKAIVALLRDNDLDSKSINNNNAAVTAKKVLLNHLINTAFFTKRQLTNDESFMMF
jgi:hypothetical protein